MACVSRAVVVGGGIAGFAASIALAKAGVLCDVLELAPEPHGAALGISGRAPEALVELGIYDETYAVGTPFLPTFTAAAHHDQDGRLLSAGADPPTNLAGLQNRDGRTSAGVLENSGRGRRACRREHPQRSDG